MKQEVKTPILVGAVVVIAGVALFFGFRTLNGIGSLDHGQVQYTPGTPPWMEKDAAKRGPGGSPSGPGPGQPSGNAQASAPANGPAKAPPGMTAPTLGGGSSN